MACVEIYSKVKFSSSSSAVLSFIHAKLTVKVNSVFSFKLFFTSTHMDSRVLALQYHNIEVMNTLKQTDLPAGRKKCCCTVKSKVCVLLFLKEIIHILFSGNDALFDQK